MADIQIAVIDEKDTQIALAVPGIQGPAGAISSGGSANQVFYKVSGTNYDAGWTFIGNANVDASAAIAGTKISPNFGSQTIATTGVFSHALGAAATPSLTFTGDTNTGIYSPGADQLAVATNGAGALFVDAFGRVGVGAISSGARFEVRGGSGPYMYIVDSGANGGAFVAEATNSIVNIGATYLGAAAVPLALVVGGNEKARIRADGTFEIKGAGTAGTSPGFSVNPSTPANSFVIDSSGRLGIGTSGPGQNITVQSSTSGTAPTFKFQNPVDSNSSQGAANNLSAGQLLFGATGAFPLTAKIESVYNADANFGRSAKLIISGANGGGTLTERLTIDEEGRVGIGTTSPGSYSTYGNKLVVYGTGTNGPGITIATGAADTGSLYFADGTTGNEVARGAVSYSHGDDALLFQTSATEKVRIDSSGRLLIGTSTSITALTKTIELHGAGDGASVPAYQIYAYPGTANTSAGHFDFFRSASSTLGTNTLVGIDDRLGQTRFFGADGSTYIEAARIAAEVDGTPGASDMPGRLVFSTTADGLSSPTERMRITSGGAVVFNTDSIAAGGTNSWFGIYGGTAPSTSFAAQSYQGVTAQIDRRGNDGNLITFYQDGTEEGTISVLGTTVSYNGAHLSRWSQLASGAERTEILRGSVLSNLDEMCEWGEEDNEQLNRMKVSDVEGDKNVSGVFQCWDDDDDTYTDDFYCAMTGDFIIRIAESVTVERGDLLMSAGDGTAKPQDDDIIRSKTVAKVTSTNVSCTYEDGSYCVPCVLMACQGQ